MADFITGSGSVLLDTDPTSPTTPLGLRRTDLTTTTSALTLAEVSMFSAGTTSPQGVIALRTLNPGSSTGLVERMRIHTNGFVGIGTPSPTQALEVAGTVKATAFQGNGSALTGISDPLKVSKAGDTMTGPLNLPTLAVTAGANLATSSGNVGIGTTAPIAKLQVAAGAIMPAAGNSSSAGLLFPPDPGGGGWDSAWIRYYPRSGEACTLEIGVSNDADDHIALMPSGNVGIGTTTPQAKLDVQGDIFAGNSAIYFTHTNHNHTGFGNTAGYACIENTVSHGALMILGRAGTAKGRCVKLWDYLQVNGDLDVTGTVRTNGAYLFVNGAGGEQAYIGGDGWGGDIQIGTNYYWINNMAAYNMASGSYMNLYARSFISTSDVRDKDQIEGVSGALDKLLRLRGVSFRWKEQPKDKAPEKPKEKVKEKQTKEIGLIAQEVQAVCPEAISEGRNGHLSLSYNSITALLVEAVKEQAAQIKEQAAQMNELKQKISDLEKLVKH